MLLSKTFAPLAGGASKRQPLALRGAAAYDLELNLTLPSKAAGYPVSVGVTSLEFGAPSVFAVGGLTVVLTALSPRRALMQMGTMHGATGRWACSDQQQAPAAGACSAQFQHTFPIKPGETILPLRLLVDHLVVESFAAGGRGVASSIIEYVSPASCPLALECVDKCRGAERDGRPDSGIGGTVADGRPGSLRVRERRRLGGSRGLGHDLRLGRPRLTKREAPK